MQVPAVLKDFQVKKEKVTMVTWFLGICTNKVEKGVKFSLCVWVNLSPVLWEVISNLTLLPLTCVCKLSK